MDDSDILNGTNIATGMGAPKYNVLLVKEVVKDKVLVERYSK